MASSPDTEITLGTGKLLGLFFFLVAVCAVFFALGYTLGRKSDVGFAATNSASGQTPSSPSRASGSTAQPSAPAMTFSKSLEQKDVNPQLTPASSDTSSAPSTTAGTGAQPGAPAASQTPNQPDPLTTLPTSPYFVQVAAVTKQEDADALVDALKKKQYPAFVSPNSGDKLFRVQVGPFTDIKDAESMRSRLINDGYSPIVKK
ncbi:MAG TPA: SPOR domain-containing protein [Candidatus Aquilonibacter sp.]|nr:SPOR domain-containing protein [Candidatus Aquilonibacter sp.]